MKKLFILLLAFPLLIAACSSDDDDKVNREELMVEYWHLLDKMDKIDTDISKKEKELRGLVHQNSGIALILREEIWELYEKRSELIKRKNEIENILDIKGKYKKGNSCQSQLT